jgi:hypothetical protein
VWYFFERSEKDVNRAKCLMRCGFLSTKCYSCSLGGALDALGHNKQKAAPGCGAALYVVKCFY